MDFEHDSSLDTTQNLKKTLVEERSLWRVGGLESLLRALSPGERLVLYGLSVLLAVSTLALLAGLNSSVSVTVPASGGELIEGEVGSARFINPILTISQADEDISKLVYSGLTRSLPDGIVPDLAESYEISEDGTTYTFTLRDNLKFGDGSPVTTKDVIASLKRWGAKDGVGQRLMSYVDKMEAVDDKTFRMVLTKPYGMVLESLGKTNSSVAVIIEPYLATVTAVRVKAGSLATYAPSSAIAASAPIAVVSRGRLKIRR